MGKLNVEELNIEYSIKSAEDVIRRSLEEFGTSRIALASSLSIEDQVLTDMILKIDSSARIFVIDTGRHFEKTYDLMDITMRYYEFNFEVYAPKNEELEALVSQNGPNLFYDSVEKRKSCCGIRKVEPLNRVLSTVDAWICGLRRDQGQTRQEINLFELDTPHSIYKINPIAFWSEKKIWEYIKKEKVPYSKLYDEGFKSIGCQPCTRVVKPGEDIRGGRWWWESADKKECGLHSK